MSYVVMLSFNFMGTSFSLQYKRYWLRLPPLREGIVLF
jgi:hypothetical protein